ncbi:hypothetical protein ACQR16_18785 [Bradyrhizobium oligotrophicum]|uniref:hypothetical protein n=1 Tax=Bradyrhizobium oligotrophicum TaxID=44255 RepID=UPI003EB700D0
MPAGTIDDDDDDDGAAVGAGAAEPVPAAGTPELTSEAKDEVLPDADVLVTSRVHNEVEEALELAEYIVKHGAKRNDSSLPSHILRTIKVTAGKVGLFERQQALERGASPETIAAVYIKASDWTRFELAYYALAEFSAPITIETLRDTRSTGKRQGSPAQRFTRLLWAITGLFAVLVVGGGIITTGAESSARNAWVLGFRAINDYVPILVPWMYGGLGACAYLLRTAHDMIAKRCFDVRRQPEYFNRILLGMVSGGAIVLLVSPSDDSEAVKISAAALGFLAGYSNDLLFNAVERVTAALLPKVGLETVQRENFVPKQIELPTGGLTLKELMERMEQAAKPEDKELYRSLIEKLRDRL